MRLLFIVPIAITLAACHSMPVPDPQTEDECRASQHQELVRTQAATIDEASLPAGTRIIYPDTAVTRDYRKDRMNIYVNAEGEVTRVDCG